MSEKLRDIFLSQLATPLISERLFAQVPDIVFCIKNLDGIYISANQAFAFRLGLPSYRDIIGKSASQLFPEYLASIYMAQDQTVFTSGQDIIDQLELVNSSQRGMGWYLATKLPLKGRNDEVIGLASISRDLQKPGDEDLKFAGLARTVDFIQKHFSEDLKLSELAAKIDLSVIQLDRRMKKIFKLSTSQFIRKTRIEAASKMLKSTNTPIAEISLACGYGDQSAFTRQFKSTVGLTPGEYRLRLGLF